jgi:DNA-binding NtrC family response regulator
LSAIRSRPWPGGEPELLARLEHGLVFASGDTITPESLELAPARGNALQTPSLQVALETMRMLYVAAVIKQCEGNRTQAARALSCDARSVFRYVETLQREDASELRATWSLIRGLINEIGSGPLV